MPHLTVVPFVLLLLTIAVVPLALPHFWESNRNRGLICALLSLPIGLYLAIHRPALLGHAASEYASFIALLSSLYIIASHIVVHGGSPATAWNNTTTLLVGSLMASLIGTTGASMLLCQPLLRSNAGRRRKTHVMVFFIFLVSNIGGLLTPLGDPPLYLGFLRGVPFVWTLRLWPKYVLVVGLVLTVFWAVDAYYFWRDGAPPARASSGPLKIAGARNGLFLAGVIAVIAWGGGQGLSPLISCACMLSLTAVCWFTAPPALRAANAFSWQPLAEVAILFAGIFVTMQPPSVLLAQHGTALATHFGLTHPWHFFWLSGLLSSVLDNAPTYVTATTVACSLVGADAHHLQTLCAGPGQALLDAICCGAVMMGANTYLGNGPNFMVKAIAEKHHVAMPSFTGYIAYSVIFLWPIFALLTWLFYRS